MAVAAEPIGSMRAKTKDSHASPEKNGPPCIVSPEALSLTFIKYKGIPEDHNLPGDREILQYVTGQLRLACFHHYDEICIMSIKGGMRVVGTCERNSNFYECTKSANEWIHEVFSKNDGNAKPPHFP